MIRRRDPTLVAIAGVIAIGALIGIAMMLRMDWLLSDELFHRYQIRYFQEGRWELIPQITTIPGYHLVVSGIGRIVGGPYSDTVSRLATLAGGLWLLPLASGIVTQSRPGEGPMRAAQIFFQPILYPFFFLIYTDTWGLVALAALVLATVRGRIALAGLAGLAAIAIRQDLIIWVVFALLILALEGDTWRARWSIAIRRGWPLVLVGVVFAGFLAWNHGSVALGDQKSHERPFNITNLWIFLLYAWAVLLPYHLWNLERVLLLLRRKAVVAGVALGFVAYWVTYSNLHVYNQESFWLHNALLLLMTHEDGLRAILYVPIAWAALSFAATPMPEKRFGALYVFAPLSIVLHPLIEQRYYLPPLVLFMCWRPAMPPRWEWSTLSVYAATALYLFWNISGGRYFL